MASIYRIPSGWRAQVRITGKPSTSKVFPTKAEATRWAREQESPGFTDLGKSKSPHTVNSMIATYRSYSSERSATDQSVFKTLEHYLGAYRVAEITPTVILEFAKRRSQEVLPAARKLGVKTPPIPSTVLRDISVLRSVLTHAGTIENSEDAARALGVLTRTMPTLRHLRLVAQTDQRNRRPTEDELQRIEEYFARNKHTAAPIFDMILFAICTCVRRSEMVSVTWEDYDEAAQTLLVRSRKDPVEENRTDTLLPLLEGPVVYRGKVVRPRDILARQKTAAVRTSRIFPWLMETPSAALRRAAKSLQIDDLTFHDLRHDGISRLFEYGLDIPRVAMISGHKTWANLKRYTHIKVSNIHEFALSLSQKSPDRG